MKLYDNIRNEIETITSMTGDRAVILEKDCYIKVDISYKNGGFSMNTLRENYTPKRKSLVIKRIRQSLTGNYTDNKKRLYSSVNEMLSYAAASVKRVGC